MIRPSTPRGARGLPLALLLTALVVPALAGCDAATRDTILTCTVAEDCGPGSRCIAGACQASTPPTADFTLPAAVTTNRVVSVAATAADPDPGDAVTEWRWDVTRLSGACEADLDVADGPTLQAVFWCAGTYEVTLTVTDTVGATSAPVRRSLAVTALDGAPSVAVGPAVAVDHRCAGTPLRCELVGPVGLSASGQAPLGGPLAFRWTALPPDASRAAAAAVLSPSASAQAPTLAIATDGGPLSGAWRLRVRVEDAQGNLAQAVQLVTVGNRPPALDAAPLALDHRYEGGAYLAGGPLALPVSDPDGDPVSVSLALEEPSGSGCTARLSDVTAAGGTYALTCPGPTGLLSPARALLASISDANGESIAVTVPIRVQNRLPVVRPAGGVSAIELDHGVGPCPSGAGTCFLVAGANPFVVDDPDGDPVSEITLVAGVEAGRPSSGGDAQPGPGGGTFRFWSSVGAPAEFRDAAGTSGFWLSGTVSDPFGASAPAQPALPIRIRNRPPSIDLSVGTVSVAHRYDAARGVYLADAPLVRFLDPDGDPLDVSASTGDESCAAFSVADGILSVTCARPYVIGPASYPTLAGFAGGHALVGRATDGWATVAEPVTARIASEPPTLPSYTGAVEACGCVCTHWDKEVPGTCAADWTWAADPTQATFPVRPADDDGDPLAMTFQLAPGAPVGASVTPATRYGLPQSCAATVKTSSFPVSVLVTANDGVSQAAATWTVTKVTCAKTGELCGGSLARR